MGKTMMGEDAKQVGQANLMGPDQMQYLTSMLQGLGPQALDSYKNLLSGYDEGLFQKGVVDPAMKQYQNQVLPSIQQRFTDANAGSSSALNQALTTSATDLQSSLSGQRLQMQQGAQNNQLQVLAQLLGLTTSRQYDPIVQGPSTGILPDLMKGGASLGAAAIASSREVKENIRDYHKGLEELRNFKVKQYDYTIDTPGPKKNRVGLIAEELPAELLGEVHGIKAVDLYGLISILINSVKQLDGKIKELEVANAYHL